MIGNVNAEAVTMDLISVVENSSSRKMELNLDLCLALPNTHENPNTVPNPHNDRRTWAEPASGFVATLREANNYYYITAPPPPPPVPVVIPTPPAPVVTNLSCPICIGPFIEETSTRCGHIFCRGCIMRSLAVKSACPTCRKKVTKRSLIRVFLPVSNNP